MITNWTWVQWCCCCCWFLDYRFYFQIKLYYCMITVQLEVGPGGLSSILWYLLWLLTCSCFFFFLLFILVVCVHLFLCSFLFGRDKEREKKVKYDSEQFIFKRLLWLDQWNGTNDSDFNGGGRERKRATQDYNHRILCNSRDHLTVHSFNCFPCIVFQSPTHSF